MFSLIQEVSGGAWDMFPIVFWRMLAPIVFQPLPLKPSQKTTPPIYSTKYSELCQSVLPPLHSDGLYFIVHTHLSRFEFASDLNN